MLAFARRPEYGRIIDPADVFISRQIKCTHSSVHIQRSVRLLQDELAGDWEELVVGLVTELNAEADRRAFTERLRQGRSAGSRPLARDRQAIWRAAPIFDFRAVTKPLNMFNYYRLITLSKLYKHMYYIYL